jgi:putative cofactor-binding repeat protein
MSTPPESLKRRDFLKTSSLAAISAAALATGAASASASAAPQNLAQAADSKSTPATSAPEPIGPRATFHALDYYRPGRSDADVIQAAIDAAIAKGGPADVVLENKTYRIDRTIKIHQTRDLTLEGNGALLLMTQYIMAINVHDCTQVRLANMAFDYDPLPFTQGEVVGVDLQTMTWDLKIDAGYPSGPEFLTMLRLGSTLIVDEKQRIIKRGTVVGGVIARAERQPNGVVRIFTEKRQSVEGLRIGDVAVLASMFMYGGANELGRDFFNRYWHWQHSVIRMINTESCDTDRLTFNTGPSALYDFMGNGGNRHTNISVRPGPRPAGAARDRQLSVTMDVFQSCAKKRGPLVENWFIDRSHDDGIVLWGYFSKVIEQPAPDRVVFTPIYRDVIAAGDLIEIRDIDDTVKGTARVSAIQPVHRPDLAGKNRDLHENQGYPLPYPWTPEDLLEIKLETGVTAEAGDRIIALNRRNQGAVIRNNHVRGVRARGIKIRASEVLVENNLVEDTTMSGIELAAERELLMLGAPQDNIVIRGNRIRNVSLYQRKFGSATVVANAAIRLLHCGKSVKDQYSREAFSKVVMNRNITIENNVIENTAEYGILCANASQVVIRGNVIRGANQMEPQTNALGFKPDSAILVAASDHVTVENNAVTPGKYGRKDVAEFESTAVTTTSR